MKNVITKITSLFLALLVLISTFSFTVESHYCGDYLIDISFTGDAEVCKNDVKTTSSKQMKDCCSDEVLKIEGQKELQKLSFYELDFSKQQFVVAFTISYTSLFVPKSEGEKLYQHFYPPDNQSDFQVLYQSFLI
ncbi:HYC_CC_PP family protein [Polaribacter tangerinus]|uniref:HYC_CC_PP family protein n=1 Tax=Polaribacter tangerinus TaxID=1920034 RepID=UPI000B4B73CA|nr:hypothetical protein [Polaribacter tangerinus]